MNPQEISKAANISRINKVMDYVSYEYYYNDHSGKPDHRLVLDICIPVKSL